MMGSKLMVLVTFLVGVFPADVGAQRQARTSRSRVFGERQRERAPRAPRSTEEIVRATFDPEGPYDDAGFWKDMPGILPAATPFPTGPGAGGTGPTRAVPANDDCSQATVIPGNTINYNPSLLNVTGAGGELCDASESCESGGAGTSNSVWYQYSPDQDGIIVVDTFGSNFNTVLSIHSGCGYFGAGFQCYYPTELGCNDDYFFGNTSQLYQDVHGGQTYMIKVSDYNTSSGGGMLDFNLRYIPPNDSCENAVQVYGTAFAPQLMSTHNAVADSCGAEESCESGNVGTSNSVWYRFVAPCDGYVSMNTNGTDYDTVLSIFDGCGAFVSIAEPCNLPNEIDCDDDGGTGLNSQLIDVPVQGGIEYRIKVSDYNMSMGGGYLDFHFFFEAANEPLARIDSPSNLDCVCSSAVITGSAESGTETFAAWDLEFTPLAGGAWTTISSSSDPVSQGTLGIWDTSALPEGSYFLRLTVENACGSANSTCKVVEVDHSFGSVFLAEPADLSVYGGLVCANGTVLDTCLSQWDLGFRPAGSGGYTPLSTGSNPVPGCDLIGGAWITTGLADGDYEVRLTAVDACGSGSTVVHTIAIDNTLPTAQIASPSACTRLNGTVVITGTADDAHLDRWELAYVGGSQADWTQIATGTTPVIDGTLGIWNVGSLPRCTYALKLTVWDRSRVDCSRANVSEHVIPVTNELIFLGTPSSR